MPRSHFGQLKEKAEKLRLKGKTYSEIKVSLGVGIPKSTLSLWFKGLKLPRDVDSKIRRIQKARIEAGLEKALIKRGRDRKDYLAGLLEKNKHLADLLKNKDIAKIALAVLYWGEGTKSPKRSILTFGNSDPKMIGLFLKLLRKCYEVDEAKLRCTVQCRADQDTKKLESFWRNVTGIPLSNFYNSRIDPRTIGKKSRKPEYRGVCRIDYFSALVLNDILKVIEVITGL